MARDDVRAAVASRGLSRRCCCALMGTALMEWRTAYAAAGATSMYPSARLLQEKPRFENRIGHLYQIISNIISQNGATPQQRRILQSLRLDYPLIDPHGSPMNFFSRSDPSGPQVTMPVLSLLFVEDLCLAYAWLDRHGYSLETIDEYVTMLRNKPPPEFPGGQIPPPLEALRIPAAAVNETGAGELGLRLRNSAYAFILSHELGHRLLGHPDYDRVTAEQSRANEMAADEVALGVLRLASEIPMGAMLWFLAAAYMVPSEGQFLADGRSAAEWQKAVSSELTHPVTEERLRAIVGGLQLWSSEEARPAERETLQFIAIRLAEIARTIADVDLQRCMSVAARNADLSVLTPAPAGPSARFLGLCLRGHRSAIDD